MFLNVDYNKEKLESEYYLATPNKKIITSLYYVYEDSMSIRLGELSEAKISIPFYIEDKNFKSIRNPSLHKIREKMLIKIVFGSEEEWFIINEIKDSYNGEGKELTLIGLGYELKSKQSLVEGGETRNIEDISKEILKSSTWKVSYVDDKIKKIYRDFESKNTNSLDSITNLADVFGVIIVWDTKNRGLEFHNPEEYGAYKGLNLTERLLDDLEITSNSEEVITRLYAYGDKGINFSSVSPNGEPYLEDFSYFLFPFEKDLEGNILNSSNYMSDNLCLAIIEYNEKYSSKLEIIKKIMNEKDVLYLSLSPINQTLEIKKIELEGIFDRLDVAKLTNSTNVNLINTIKQQETIKKEEIRLKEEELLSIKTEIKMKDEELLLIKKELDKNVIFGQELLEELNPYIIESTYEEQSIIEPVDLYEESKKVFNKMKIPNVRAKVSSLNIFNAIEEQYYWDKIIIGDYANISHEEYMNDFKVQIVGADYNFSDGLCSLIFSNEVSTVDRKSSVQSILYNSKNTTSTVNSNKKTWGEVELIGASVEAILNDEWDANKNRISAGIDNTISMGKRGLKISNPEKPNELIVIQSGIIAVSDDYGETWKSSITADGLVAERLNGNIITGEKLAINNENNLFRLDGEGMKFHSGTTEMTNPDGTNQTIQNFKSVTEENILKKVSKNDVMNSINSSSEIIPIEGRRVSITKDTPFEDGIINSDKIIEISPLLVQSGFNNISSSIEITTEGLESYSSEGKRTSLNKSKIDFYNTLNKAILNFGLEDDYNALIELAEESTFSIKSKNEIGTTENIFSTASKGIRMYKDLFLRGNQIKEHTDTSLKKDIVETSLNGIYETKKIKIRDFKWNELIPENVQKKSGLSTGVDSSSEDLLNEISEDGYLSIDMIKVIILNLKTNQEIIKEIEELKLLNKPI